MAPKEYMVVSDPGVAPGPILRLTDRDYRGTLTLTLTLTLDPDPDPDP